MGVNFPAQDQTKETIDGANAPPSYDTELAEAANGNGIRGDIELTEATDGSEVQSDVKLTDTSNGNGDDYSTANSDHGLVAENRISNDVDVENIESDEEFSDGGAQDLISAPNWCRKRRIGI